jgi:hypothetical protein
MPRQIAHQVVQSPALLSGIVQHQVAPQQQVQRRLDL